MKRLHLVLPALLAMTAFADAAAPPDETLTVEDQRRALGERLDQLGRQLEDDAQEPATPRRWSQWYNWGNWNNGFSNWRNW